MSSRALTASELTKMRSDGQWSRLFVMFRKPSTIYTARVNGAPTSNDMVGQIDYDGGSGTLANVKVGMAMLVGTTAGARDLGIARIRKTPSATVFYIGECSEISWADNAYLTIVDDELGLWAKHIKIISEVPYMDYDVAYSDQHTNFKPTPMMGSDVVVKRTGSTVTVSWPSASGSYVVDGSAISSYSWAAPGASGTTGLTTATPTFTYNADGQYRVYLTVTAANGKSTTGARTIYVYSDATPPESAFVVAANPRGDYATGGWAFGLEMKANADTSMIEDRTKVILFAEDHYGDPSDPTSIGPVSQTANIVCTGWISGESIEMNPYNDNIKFRVTGAQDWFMKLATFPLGLERRTAGANAWTNMLNLTVRYYFWHLLQWRCNASEIMDIRLTSDTRAMESLNELRASLWSQMYDASNATILAEPFIDRFGNFYCYVNQQLIPAADRASIHTIMTLAKSDWAGSMSIERRNVSEIGRVELSGVRVVNGEESLAIFSLAPGHVSKRYGDVLPADHLLLSSQAQANALAGLILGYNNRAYDFEFTLAQNNRMIDLMPYCYLGVSIATTDNIRRISYTGNIVPRTVEYVFDANSGRVQVNVSAEQESLQVASMNGDIPPDGEPPPSDPPDIELPDIPDIPPGPTPDPGSVDIVIINVWRKGIYYTKDFSSDSPHWYAMNGGLPSQNHIDCVVQFEVTSTGALFLLTAWGDGTQYSTFWNMGGAGNIDIDQEVYWAPELGGMWTRIFNNVDLSYGTGAYPRGPKIRAIGVNRATPDECFLQGHHEASIVHDNIEGSYIGDSSGFTLVTGYHAAGLANAINGFGGGVWLNDGHWCTQVPAGAGGVSVDRFGHPPTAMAIATSGGSGKEMLVTSHLPGSYVVALTAPIQISSDNGLNWISPMGAPSPYDHNDLVRPGRCQSVGIDPTGQFLLLGDTAGILTKKSSDYGYTWGNVATLSGVTSAVWNLDSPSTWIIGFAGQIRYSEDTFGSYTDKTGDLWTWTGPSPVILSIRSLS